MTEDKKKIDEAWKEQVEKEKQEADAKSTTYYEVTFSSFISSLSMQAMIFLGKIENPISKKIEKNLEQARFLIDTLGMIKDKTKNNLTVEEEKLLSDYLFNLRMLYVEEKSK